MPLFKYTAKNKDGKPLEGRIEASSYEEVLSTLSKQKIYLTSLKEENRSKFLKVFGNFFNRVPLKEKMMFTNELSIMVKSGMPVLPALKTLAENSEKASMRKVLTEVANDVEGGFSLSMAFAKHENVFNQTYVKIVESGEKSGKLDEVLKRLTKSLENDYDTISKIRGALAYPAFILAMMVIVLVIVLVYVVPQLSSIFAESGAKLPFATRVIIATSSFCVKYWWVIIIALSALIYLFNRFIHTARGGMIFDRAKMKIPIFGKLLKNIYLTRFARSLSALLAAGVPMLEVLETTKDIVGNRVFKKDMEAVIKKVNVGQSLSESLKTTEAFPPLIVELISVGEKSGKIDFVLKNLARFLNKEVDNTTKNLTSILEPVLMVIMGVGIAFIVASVIMPIYGLVQVIGG